MQPGPVLRSALRFSRSTLSRRHAYLCTSVTNSNLFANLASRQPGSIENMNRRGFAQGAEESKDTPKPDDHSTNTSGGSSGSDSEPAKPETGSSGSDSETAKPETKTADDSAAEPEAGETKLSPLEELEKELAGLNEKVSKTKHELLLTLADFENNKKKQMTERQSRSRRAMINCATKMVNVFDELETLAKSGKSEDVSESCQGLHEGIMMTTKVYKSTLERFDIAEFSSSEIGTSFQAARHEEVGSVEVDGAPANEVAEIVRPGWILEPESKQAQVIRKAQVKVAKGGPPTPPPP